MEDHKARLKGTRILLVEDNPLNQELVMALLTDAGIEVVLADEGQQAIDALRIQPFDGVLMDCHMPGMDGYQTTRAIRAQSQHKDLPIIAMTASTMRFERDMAIDAGMNDHLTKPIHVATMYETIARWVRPAEARPIADAAPAPAPLADLPGIDVAAGLARTLGNQKLYRRMLLLFREGHQEFSFRFRAALAEGDMRSATRLVHNLGSVAGTIGADTLRQRSVALESACSRAADRAEIDALHDAVEVELLPVMTGLRELA